MEPCICEDKSNPCRSGVPGIIALCGHEDGLPLGMDYIQACPVCGRYETDQEAVYAYYALSSPKAPTIKPEDFLTSDQLNELIEMYDKQPFAVDRLPYSTVFEAMLRVLNSRTEIRITGYVLYSILMTLRKQERLPHKR